MVGNWAQLSQIPVKGITWLHTEQTLSTRGGDGRRLAQLGAAQRRQDCGGLARISRAADVLERRADLRAGAASRPAPVPVRVCRMATVALNRSRLMNAGWLVRQLGDVLVPLLGREASGCGTDPFDGVLDVQVPEPGRAVVAAAG